MRYLLILKAVQALMSNPNYKRKLKMFLIAGTFSFVLVGGLVVWAGIASVNYIASATKNVSISDKIPPALASPECWSKVTALLNFQVWLERPPLENLSGVWNTCLGRVSREPTKSIEL